MPPADSPLIVTFLTREWYRYARRPHWTAIARRADVLALEPPVALLTLFRNPGRLRQYLRGGRKPHRSESGVWLWRPLSLVSTGLAYRMSWLARFDGWWIRKQLRPVVNSLTKPNHVIVSCVVKGHQFYLRDAVDADLLCFEITDEYRVLISDDHLNPSSPRTVLMTRRERHILEKAGLVIVSSGPLLQSRSKEFPNTHYLPNCVDYDRFSRKISDWQETADDLAALPEPRLGYVGGLNDWMDLELLVRLAESYPEASLVFIGRESGSRRFRRDLRYLKLKSMTNVFFLGYKLYETLPAYLHGLDVCLLPFRTNEWIRNCSPNKTFQYLAAGKPVVSTDFPEARRVESVISVASSADEFIDMVGEALNPVDDSVIARRLTVARENSTELRADKVMSLIQEALTAKRGEAG